MIVIPSPFTSDINELKNYISQAENLPAGRQVIPLQNILEKR